ncbi:hypothetical protein [Nonomuraea sp. JJY05]|uniref:hypothetical protein n=1 Tax=Nonomuraea sp. JJY05 TaxID=3350255 RepID=UPI00373FC426
MTADVAGAVTAGFFLVSRIKEPATAYFNSRSKGSGQPTLRLTLADGSVKSFTATHDTYIQAGSVAGTVFGDEYLVQVRDEGPARSPPGRARTSRMSARLLLGWVMMMWLFTTIASLRPSALSGCRAR